MDFRRYINWRNIEWDEAKSASNKVKHGFGFNEFIGFDADPTVRLDDRFDYGEVRLRAFGRIDGAACAIVFTLRGDKVRLIGWRRAHEEEIKHYER